MKHLYLSILACCCFCLSATAQRVYINPGHGDWGPNSRPMATVPFPNLHATTGGPDTLGFYESNTNLWKAFALNEKLQGAGYTTMMSRTENGPYPYVYGDESIDKPLLDICAEVNLFEADYFISIHSNANVDGDNVNYPLIIHSGYDGAGFRDERNMALHTWPRLFEAFGNDKDHKNIEQGFEPNSAYSLDNRNVRGSISFYGYNLSTLLHDYQGYLVEGYFHTYQPARHRALNPEWCRQEGIRYFRGIQDYYRNAGENVGYIMGCVRSLTEMSHHLFNSMSTSYDEFLPINGAKVVLRDASGNIIRTECYRHVARHMTDQYYYTTDHNYNGIFVFENLQPGEYTLTVHAAGYQDKDTSVTVTADATVYPEIFLTKGQGTEPQINVDIKWALDGGTVDGQLPQTITEEYTLPTPSKAGYIFLGWFDNPNGTGTPLTSIPAGWKGTLYAIGRETSVKWELNGGHISENKLLWEDFQKTKLQRGTLEPIEKASEVINEVGGKAIYDHLSDPVGEYKWLGDYLWNKASGIEQGLDAYARWGIWLNTFLNCTTYTVNDITLDFTELGKYDSWKSWATEEIRQKVTLPNQITSDYTIPTPEKEGATFQGWYDNPHGMGDPITVLRAGYEGTVYAIWVGPVPCILAYDLNCKYKVGAMAFDFSFYANTQPASGKLIFYNKNGETEEEYILNNLRQGKNTVFMPAENIPGYVPGKDILWEVHLEARPSTLFAEIFRFEPSEPSESFNTAYATIDNSPESDFFGSIWVANQQKHGYSNGETDGEILRLVPEQGYARDKEAFADGFEVIFRPTVAPDGKVYLTDNGQSYGGVFVMDPHTKEITNFFAGCDYENGEWKDENGEWKDENGVWKNKNVEWIANNDKLVGSGSTGAHIYWTEDVNDKKGFNPTTSKLFLMHNTHLANNKDDNNGETRGFFVYDLMGNTPSPQYTKLKNIPNQKDGIQDYVNTGVTDYAIVGTSRGAWVCQTRNEDKNVISDPSLTFYPSDNSTPTIFTKSLDTSVGGIFGDNELIHGSFGSAIAVNKTENLLAMVGGTGNIMLFDITWNGSVPTLSNKRDYPVVADDPNTKGIYDIPTITTLNFDYAGNLVATLGETYNDSKDQHEVVIFTLPKTENEIDVPSRFSQRVPSLVEDDQCNSIAKVNTPYETVEIHRKMQKGMYNTICLPFAIDDLNTLPEDHPYYNATVVEFVGTERIQSGKEEMLQLNFSKVTSMQAGMPYLIQPTKDITNPYYFSNVQTGDNVVGKSVTPANSEATFQGITSPTDLDASLPIVFLVDQNRLAVSTTSGQMLGNRAYFTLHDSQNIPKRSVISIVKAPTNNHNLYINTTPTSYKIMEDGHIWIIRGGEKYNLMGAKVK